MFELLRPSTVDAVLAWLEEYGERAQILAGGTDLLLQIRVGKRQCPAVLAIGGVEVLKGISLDESHGVPLVHIKSCTTLEQVKRSAMVAQLAPAVQAAAATMATWQVRSLATVGGNICNASPAADLAPSLIAMGATVNIVGVSGERTVPVGRFFAGPGRTVLVATDLVTSVDVPAQARSWTFKFVKHSLRRANDLSTVSVCAGVKLSPDGVVQDARIVLGAAAPVPAEAAEAAQALVGSALGEATIGEAAELARKAAQPISDVRGSREYRLHMVGVLVRDALVWIARQCNAGASSGDGRGEVP